MSPIFLINQDFLEDLPPLVSIQLGGAALDGIAGVFEQYMDMLVKALPGQEGEEEGKRKVSSQFITLQLCIFMIR